MTSPRPTVFARTSSGLVRDIGWFNVFTFTATGIGFQFSFYYAASLAPLVGGNMLVGFLVMAAALLLSVLSFTTFISIMPRSGGDYIYNSRVLHPGIGFVANVIFMVCIVMFSAITAVTLSSTQLSQLLAYWGVVYNNPSLISWASVLTEPTWVFGLGFLWIILGTLCAVGSTRLYFRLQNTMLLVTIIGIIAIIAALIYIPSQSSFASSFNQFVSQYNGTSRDYYSGVISAAQQGGWVIPDQTSLWGGLLYYPILAEIGFCCGAAMLGGEIRQAKRSYFIGSFLGVIYWLVPLGVCLVLLYNRLGFNFMSSIDWILYNSPSSNPLPAIPYVNLLVSVATNPTLASIIFLAGAVQLFVYIPQSYVTMSRAVFAYSFDGLFPTSFADISSKTKGPLKAILVAAVITVVLFVIINIPQSATYAYLFSSVASWLITIPNICLGLSCIALVVGKRHRELEATAPIRGVKLVIVGVLAIVSLVLCDYLYLSQAVYGANTPIAIELAVGLLIVFSVFYVVRRVTYPNLALAFKEVPPA